VPRWRLQQQWRLSACIAVGWNRGLCCGISTFSIRNPFPYYPPLSPSTAHLLILEEAFYCAAFLSSFGNYLQLLWLRAPVFSSALAWTHQKVCRTDYYYAMCRGSGFLVAACWSPESWALNTASLYSLRCVVKLSHSFYAVQRINNNGKLSFWSTNFSGGWSCWERSKLPTFNLILPGGRMFAKHQEQFPRFNGNSIPGTWLMHTLESRTPAEHGKYEVWLGIRAVSVSPA